MEFEKEVKKAYVNDVLDLDCDVSDLFDDEAIATIFDMINNNSIIDPCNPDKSSATIIYEALDEKCAKGGADNLGTVEDLMKDIGDSGDWIWETNDFTNCPKLKCIFNDLLALNDNWACNNLFSPFKGSQQNQLILDVEPLIKDDNTEYFGKNFIKITLNDYDCNNEINSSYLSAADLLIHELVHAYFFLTINEDPNSDIYKKKWQKYVNENFGIEYNTQHQVMVKEFMKKMAKVLMELDGNKYTYDYYMYYVWQGLEFWWPDAFTKEVIDNWKNKYNIIENNSNTYKCN